MADFVVNDKKLDKATLRIISMIQERTSEGVDRFGKPFLPYSTKTFSMPLGSFFERTTKRQRIRLNAEGDLFVYRSKRSGRKWIAIEGGYLNFKSKWSPNKSRVVNLQWRGMAGGMLSNLQIVERGDNYRIIGFKSDEAARLAFYHIISGAGRSRKIRDFLGITPSELSEITSEILDAVEVKFEGIVSKRS